MSKRKTKKERQQESIRKRFAHYIERGHPLADARAMAVHAVKAVKKRLP